LKLVILLNLFNLYKIHPPFLSVHSIQFEALTNKYYIVFHIDFLFSRSCIQFSGWAMQLLCWAHHFANCFGWQEQAKRGGKLGGKIGRVSPYWMPNGRELSGTDKNKMEQRVKLTKEAARRTRWLSELPRSKTKGDRDRVGSGRIVEP